VGLVHSSKKKQIKVSVNCQWQGQREKQEERGGKNKVHLVKGKKGGWNPKISPHSWAALSFVSYYNKSPENHIKNQKLA
jgi:hypothetical protein